ncbi:hypothetical protein [[Eubacterium] cellulosolvens]
MEQNRPKETTTTPIRIVQEPRTVRYYVGPRGIIFYLLAIMVLVLGVIGFLQYDRLVKPYLEFYICCLPAGILAAILLFFGFATRMTTARQVRVQRSPRGTKTPRTDEPSGSGFADGRVGEPPTGPGTSMQRYKPKSIPRSELIAQKRSLEHFLENLDEQHRDKLITDDVYLGLKTKYRRELTGLNIKLDSLSQKTAKKVKKLKGKGNENS